MRKIAWSNKLNHTKLIDYIDKIVLDGLAFVKDSEAVIYPESNSNAMIRA